MRRLLDGRRGGDPGTGVVVAPHHVVPRDLHRGVVRPNAHPQAVPQRPVVLPAAGVGEGLLLVEGVDVPRAPLRAVELLLHREDQPHTAHRVRRHDHERVPDRLHLPDGRRA